MIPETIEEQVGEYTRLLGLARAKQEALVGGDVAALERVVAAETATLRTLGGLELRYSEACAELGRTHGLRTGEVQDRLGQLLDGPSALRAASGLKQLAELANQLAFMIQANSQLIRRARSFVDLSLGQLARMGPGPAYDITGAAMPRTDSIPSALSRRV